MPNTLELDDTERAALVALLTAEIENTRWPLAPRTKALRVILDKLEPPQRRPEPRYRSRDTRLGAAIRIYVVEFYRARVDLRR